MAFKFDVEKLKEVKDLDFDQIVIWPFEIKLVFAVVCAVLVAAIGYYSIISGKLPKLEAARLQENQLKSSFESKYRVAVNLEENKKRLVEINETFASALRSLPTRNETPGLLDDITFVGTDAGLSFNLINWQQEITKEFYTELPIQIEVNGVYHEFGNFASNIANLPRIVTLHNFQLNRRESDLVLTLEAKTYRSDGRQEETESE